MFDDAKHLIAEADKIFADRATWDSTVQDIRNFIRPMARSIIGTDVAGEKSHQKIFDGSAETISETLTGTLHGQLCNPAERWFELESGDKRIDRLAHVAFWYEDTENRMFRIFNARESRWNVDINPTFGETADYGTGVMSIMAKPGVGIRFKQISMAECGLLENDDGVVDHLYRYYTMPAYLAAKEWGADAGARINKSAGSDNPAERLKPYRLLRVVKPAEKRDPTGAAFQSFWINADEKTEIRRSRFFEFPFMAMRWFRRGGDDGAYGRGPGHRALADVKSLQRAMRIEMRGAEKMIDPTLLVPDDGILGPVTLAASGLIHYRASRFMFANRPPVEPLLTGGRPDIGEELMAGIRGRIDGAYYGPLLRTPRDPRMLDAQILDISEERARVLGPIFSQLQGDGMDVAVERVLAIMIRNGATLPVPEELRGRDVKPTFQNPFAQARAVGAARSIARFLQINLPLANIKPEVLDYLDEDEAFLQTGAGLNVPNTIFRDAKAVARIRQERRERQDAELQAKIAEMKGKAAQTTAQALQTVGS